MITVSNNDPRVILFYRDHDWFGIQQGVDLPAIYNGPDL